LHIFRRKEFLRDIQQFEGKRTDPGAKRTDGNKFR
jgi:hypothetical protein